MARQNPPYDFDQVLTADLAVAVNRWIKEHDSLFNDTRDDGEDGAAREFHLRKMGYYSAKKYLEDHSDVPIRSITRITSLETVYTTFHVADKLVQAMERPDLWGTELHVVRNPRRPKLA